MSAPVYALNLFDVASRDEYLAYSRRSAKEVRAHGGKVVAIGKFREAAAGEIAPRAVLILVEWESKEAFDAYKESAQYEQDIEAAVDSILRLDMAPNEYGLLQRRGILKVTGYDLIERHNRKFRPGTTILYYRDRADFDPRDNLLNMLKYAVDHAAAPS